MIRLSRLLRALPVLLLFALPANAADGEQGAIRFIENLGRDAVTMLQAPELTPDQRLEEFKKLLSEGFALNAIGRFTLGKNWRRASKAQRSRFLGLFERYVVSSYAKRLGDYEGETFEIDGARDEGRNGTLVKTFVLRPGGEKLEVHWRVMAHKGAFKIVDVIIEGVSMSITQRSEFSSFISAKGGNIDAFLDELESKVSNKG